MALLSEKSNEDAAQPLWGQRFGAAAALPPGAKLYVTVGTAGDLAPVTLPTPFSTEWCSAALSSPARAAR